MHALELTLVLLGASIAMVAIVRRFGMPALVGYLAVGVVPGPTPETSPATRPWSRTWRSWASSS